MAGEITDFMKMSQNVQRMDSLMVAANNKNLSLLELLLKLSLQTQSSVLNEYRRIHFRTSQAN